MSSHFNCSAIDADSAISSIIYGYPTCFSVLSFVDADGSTEEISRRDCCCLCPSFKRLTRKDKRDRKYKYCILTENPSTLNPVKQIFSEYETNKRGIPVAVCIKHYHHLFKHLQSPQKCWTPEEKTRINNLFKDARQLRRSSLAHCTPLTKNIKRQIEKPEHPLSNLVRSRSSGVRNKRDKKDNEALRTPKRKKPRGKSANIRRSPGLNQEQLLQAGIDSGMSGRQLERHADSLRGQNGRGNHSVKVPSGSTLRKARTILRSVFLTDFGSVETKLCPDNGAAQMCTDVVKFFKKVVYMRGFTSEDVRVIKFNLDGGRGSQKLMAQIIFQTTLFYATMPRRTSEKNTAISMAATRTLASRKRSYLASSAAPTSLMIVRSSCSTISWMCALLSRHFRTRVFSRQTISNNQTRLAVWASMALDARSTHPFGLLGKGILIMKLCALVKVLLRI